MNLLCIYVFLGGVCLFVCLFSYCCLDGVLFVSSNSSIMFLYQSMIVLSVHETAVEAPSYNRLAEAAQNLIPLKYS